MEIANDSAGVSAQQFEKTLDSLETKITQLKTSFEGLYQNFVNSEMFKGVLDVITAITDKLAALPPSISTIIITITTAISGTLLKALIKTAKESSNNFIERWKKAKQEISKEPVDIKIREVVEGKKTKKVRERDEKGQFTKGSKWEEVTNTDYYKQQTEGLKELTTWQQNATKAEQEAAVAQAAKLAQDKQEIALQTAQSVAKQQDISLSDAQLAINTAQVSSITGLNAQTSANIALKLQKQGLDLAELSVAQAKLVTGEALTASEAKAIGIAKAEMAVDKIRNALGITSVSISQMSLKAQIKESAQKTKNTVVTWANTIAQIANNAAHGDLASILLVSAAVAGGVALAATVGITVATRNETKALEANQQASENASNAQQKYADGKKELIDLTEKYNRLKELENQQVLDTEEEQELIELNNELAETYPELVSYYDEEGNAILDGLPAIQQLIEEKKELNEQNREELRIAQEMANLKGMYSEGTEAGERLAQLRQSATAYANATEGDAYYDAIENMAHGSGATKKNAQKVLKQFVDEQRGFDYTLFNDIIGTDKISSVDFKGIAESIAASEATNAEEYEEAFSEALDQYAGDLSSGERENAEALVEALGGYYSVGKMFEATLNATEQLDQEMNYDKYYQELIENGQIEEEKAKQLSDVLSKYLRDTSNKELSDYKLGRSNFTYLLGQAVGEDTLTDKELNAIYEGLKDLKGSKYVTTSGLTKEQLEQVLINALGENYSEKVSVKDLRGIFADDTQTTDELQELTQEEASRLFEILNDIENANYENIESIYSTAQTELANLLGTDSKLYSAITTKMQADKEAFLSNYDEITNEISTAIYGTDASDEEKKFVLNIAENLTPEQLQALNSQVESIYKAAEEKALQEGEEDGTQAGQNAAKAYVDAYQAVLDSTSWKDSEGNKVINQDIAQAMGGLTPDENGNYDMSQITSVLQVMRESGGLSLEGEVIQNYLESLGDAANWAGLTLEENFTDIQESVQETQDIIGLASEDIKGSLDFSDMQNLMSFDDTLTPLNFRATADGFEMVGTSVYEVTARLNEKTKAEYENRIAVLERKKADLEAQMNDAETEEELNAINQKYREVTNSIGLYAQAIYSIPDMNLSTTTIQGAADNMQAMIDKTNEMIDAQKEFQEYGELSANTFISLVQSNSDYIDALDVTNGRIVLNEKVMEELRKQEVENFKTENEISIAKMEAENEILQNQIKSGEKSIQIMEAILAGELSSSQAQIALDQAKEQAMFAYAQNTVTWNGQAAEATAQFANTTFDASGNVVKSYQDMDSQSDTTLSKIKKTFSVGGQIISNFANVIPKLLTGELTLANAGDWILTHGVKEIVDPGGIKSSAKETKNLVIPDTLEGLEIEDIDEEYVAQFKSQMQNQINSLKSQYQDNVDSIRKLRKLNELADEISLTGGTLGGKGSEAAEAKEDLEEYLLELEKLYNILSKISNLEKQLEELELGRKSLIHSQDLAANDAQRLSLIKELKAQNEELLRLQEQERDAVGKELQQTYGAYVKVKDGYLEVNHAMISTIRDEEFGDHLEELIDEFDEYSDSIMETKEALSDYNDQQKEITDTARDYIVTLKDQLLDQVIAVHEAEIEAVKEKYDAIKTEDEAYLESLRNTLDRQRQLRDQEDQQEELDEKERRLALLSRDTSGIYAQEIEQLKQEIEDQRQTMADTETDNLLTSLEEQLNAQHEALDAEVEYLENSHQEKLETMTEYWAEVEEIMKGGYTNILNYLKEHDEEFITGSKEAQEQWLEEWEKNIHEALAAIELLEGKFKDVSNPNSNATVSGSTSSSGGNKGSSGGGTSAPKKTQPSVGETVTVESGKKIYTQASGGKALRPTYGTGPYTVLGAQSGRVKVRYSKLSRGVTGWFNISDLVGYAQGGLVDTTGPVMVHGTKNKPEAFLSSKDTENIAKFRDVLSDIFSNRFKLPQFEVSQNEKDGDVYYDIHIQVDGINGDYDVEDMWEKIKKEIVKDAQSRNVIAIKRSR